MINELGAEYTGEGTHFGVFSENAEAIELCLFSEDGEEETARLELPSAKVDLLRLPARSEAGPALRFPGARPMIRRTDTASTRTSCCSTPCARGVRFTPLG
ncbi:hypothetical protein ACFSHP_20730 [Novosphingobium panipatense]